MGKLKDIAGQTFNSWTAIRFESVNKRSHWWCKCKCGNVVRVATSNLTSGKSKMCRDCYAPQTVNIGDTFGEWTVIDKGKHTTDRVFICRCSCGTVKDILCSDLNQGKTTKCKKCTKTHGMSTTLFYRVWVNMKQRCESPAAQAFLNYGGRGILVSKPWQAFENFHKDMFESYTAHRKKHPNKGDTSLDRINNNEGYSKENCKWATILDQAYNRRITVCFKATSPLGVTEEVVGLNQFCKLHSLTRSAVNRCLKKGGTHKGWKFQRL